MRCPNSDRLFEWISIPSEMRFASRLTLWGHSCLCQKCRSEVVRLKESWRALLIPEPDVTQSIIKVYSRLKRDETLILSGWKLGETRPASAPQWLFRGAVAVTAILVAVWMAIPTSKEPVISKIEDSPLAQIRYEDQNRIQVRYVKPELLQSIEFETSNRP